MNEHASRARAERPHRGRSRLARLLTYAGLAGWACICLFPPYWVVATSLKGPLQIIDGPVYLPFIDFTPSLDAWAYVLFDPTDAPLLRYFNSVVVGLASTVLTVLFAVLAVHSLTRFRHVVSWPAVALGVVATAFAGSVLLGAPTGMRVFLAVATAVSLLAAIRSDPRERPALRNDGMLLAILATRILPPVVIVLPVYLMAERTGTLDTRLALVAAYTAVNLPVAVWLLQPVLGGVATELEEAAQLDGASRFRILIEIVGPVVLPGLAATALVIFVLCWNEYLFAVYLAADHARTMPPFLAAQMSVRDQQAGSDPEEWARLAAAIVLMAAPLMLLAGIVQRLVARRTLWRG